MGKRVSKKVVEKVTEAQYLEAMNLYVIADNIVDTNNARMNGEIARVRAKYNDTLNAAAMSMEDNLKVIMTYCQENKEVLFAKQRHIDNVHGVVGFRMGTPKLKTKGKMTWEKVLVKVKELLPEFVRRKEEVNKDALLDQRDTKVVAEALAICGLEVVQEDSFYIELKKETSDDKASEKA